MRQMAAKDLLSDTHLSFGHLAPNPLHIGRMRNDLPFLERLGNELTRPVIPQSAAIDYTPSQYLCEFIKKCGYQGVIYRSSVSDVMNLALFDPSLAPCGTVAQYRVVRVAGEIELDGA